MAISVTHDLITYIDSNAIEWTEVAPGAYQKLLFHNPDTGQKATLVRLEPSYQARDVPPHQWGEYVYVLEGTFVDHNQASGPGTYIHNRPGSNHKPYTPDGCTLFVFVPGSRTDEGEAD